LHNLPKAVLLLKDIKTSLLDFLWTGRGGHGHKFEKIKHILEFYPSLQYVLIGDSQHDPFYMKLLQIFPLTVKAVYIRQTSRDRKKR
jgi:phosphatidate phosphatase APP1